MCRVFHGTLHGVMWRYFFLIIKLLKLTNMSKIEDLARKHLGLDSTDPNYMHTDSDIYDMNNFKSGYECCQKEYEEKLRWIPVEEKLPKIGERVLLKNEFYEYVGFLSKNKKDFRALTVEISYSNEKIKGVTHWRSFL